jgi:hypothetical protein
MTKNTYQETIRMRLAQNGYVGQYDTRHIEAYMRLTNDTLDGLSVEQFNQEIEASRMCIDQSGSSAEMLAQSFGL